MPVKKPTQKLRFHPSIHPFLDRINDYLEWEKRRMPVADEIWKRENKSIHECSRFFKGFFSPRRFYRGCGGGLPDPFGGRLSVSIRARKAKR